MARLFKILLVLAAGFVGVLVLAAVAAFLFFDPNDFKDRLSAAVKEQTGRDLVISGDISLTYFPWLAVQVGRTDLGNAEGFSAGQMVSFDSASLSVRIMPLIFSQEVEVGTAALDGLVVNLEVDSGGRTNWDDLVNGGDPDEGPTESASGSKAGFDVASISVTGANASYSDAQAGSSYAISNLSFETGRIAAGVPITMNGAFDFTSTPGELGGHIAMRGTMTMSEGAAQISMEGLNVNGTLQGVTESPAEFNFDSRAVSIDTVAQSMDLGELDLMVLGMSMSAEVEPFSYAESPLPTATLTVSEFSLKDLMQKLGIEPPVTADPNAMQRVSFKGKAVLVEKALRLRKMSLQLDDSTMTGRLTLPRTSDRPIRFELGVDEIVLDGYMAPADERAATADEEAGDVEIPVDLIRTLNVNGSFKIDRAYMTGMEFRNLELGVKSKGGKLRLNPLAAEFYDGSYAGDVRIDASGDVPSVSVNERISNVNLGAMAKATFDVDNISGTINGGFALGGSGRNLSAIRQDLDGNMSLELLDGAWEGTDVWHQLRTARALFRQEAAPPAPDTPRTEFSNVSATGTVTDGIFRNSDFVAELPFLQLNGGGMVDLNTTGIDYQLQVRVLDKPEFMAGATQQEIDDFTETVVPLKITGTLASPNVRPDIEGIFRAQVEDALEEKKQELEDRLMQRLLGTEEPAVEEGEPGEVGEVPPGEGEQPAEEEADLEEELKKKLLNRIFEN